MKKIVLLVLMVAVMMAMLVWAAEEPVVAPKIVVEAPATQAADEGIKTSLPFIPTNGVGAIREIETDGGKNACYSGYCDGGKTNWFELYEEEGKLVQVLLYRRQTDTDEDPKHLLQLGENSVEGGTTNIVKEFIRWQEYYGAVKKALPKVKVALGVTSPAFECPQKYALAGTSPRGDKYYLRPTPSEINSIEEFAAVDFLFPPPEKGEFVLGKVGAFLFPAVQMGTNEGWGIPLRYRPRPQR